MFACLALLVVGPVLVFTSLLGVWVWGFCWAGWFVGRWVLGSGLFAEYSERIREIVVKREEDEGAKEEEGKEDSG